MAAAASVSPWYETHPQAFLRAVEQLITGTNSESSCDKWHVYPIQSTHYEIHDRYELAELWEDKVLLLEALQGSIKPISTFGFHADASKVGLDIPLLPRIVAMSDAVGREDLLGEGEYFDMDFDIVDAALKRSYFKMCYNAGFPDANEGFFAIVHDRMTGVQVAMCDTIDDTETRVEWLSPSHVDEYKCHNHMPKIDKIFHHGFCHYEFIPSDCEDDEDFEDESEAQRALRKAYDMEAMTHSGIYLGAGIELEMLLPIAAHMSWMPGYFPRALPPDFELLKVKCMRSLAMSRRLMQLPLGLELHIVSFFGSTLRVELEENHN